MAKLTKVTGKGLPLREPAEQIWLAGLGAFAMAEEEGSKLFATLVKKGRVLQKANMAKLDSRLAAVREKVDELSDVPGQAIEKVNDRFDAGMALVLHRLGVPTKREIGTLTRRVEELTRTLETKRTPPVRRTRNTRTRKAVTA